MRLVYLGAAHNIYVLELQNGARFHGLHGVRETWKRLFERDHGIANNANGEGVKESLATHVDFIGRNVTDPERA
jgi:hypothetical protein